MGSAFDEGQLVLLVFFNKLGKKAKRVNRTAVTINKLRVIT